MTNKVKCNPSEVIQPFFKATNYIELKNILKNFKLNKGDVLLDAGCGLSFLLIHIAKRVKCKVIGLDLSFEMIKTAKALSEITDESIQFVRGSITHLPFRENCISGLILSEVIEHLPDEKKAIVEIYRTLSRSGNLYITTPNHYEKQSTIFHELQRYYDDDNEHIRLYNSNTLSRLLENTGFKVKDISYKHGILWWITHLGYLKRKRDHLTDQSTSEIDIKQEIGNSILNIGLKEKIISFFLTIDSRLMKSKCMNIRILAKKDS